MDNNELQPVLLESREVGEAEDVLPKNRRLRYTVRVLRERPRLSAIAVSFLYYPLFKWSSIERRKGIGDALSAVNSAAATTDADMLNKAAAFADVRNGFVIGQSIRCEESTEKLVNLVEGSVRYLRRLAKNGDKAATRALKTLCIYDVCTGQEPYSVNMMNFTAVCAALDMIRAINGEKYEAVYASFRACREKMMDQAYLYHSTEHLLEYMQMVISDAEAAVLAENNEKTDQLIRSLSEKCPVRDGRKGPTVSLDKSVIWLVACALRAVAPLDTEQKALQRSLIASHLSGIVLTSQSIAELGAPWNGSVCTFYKSKSLAISLLECLIWGVSANDILDISERSGDKGDISATSSLLHFLAQHNYSPNRGWCLA